MQEWSKNKNKTKKIKVFAGIHLMLLRVGGNANKKFELMDRIARYTTKTN